MEPQYFTPKPAVWCVILETPRSRRFTLRNVVADTQVEAEQLALKVYPDCKVVK